MKRFSKKLMTEAEELNITAFMNLMVVLVPFLLITAVFSRLSILELNLPALNATDQNQQQVTLQLELVLREDSFDLQDKTIGLIKRFERTKDDTRWPLFTNLMVEIKARFPEERSITLLLEPSIDYKTLITTMDHVRSADVVQVTSVETIELFPDISIGDAPVVAKQIEK
jgi:biopolymer transport protein ExbD